MRYTIFTLFMLAFTPVPAVSQFYTVTQGEPESMFMEEKTTVTAVNSPEKATECDKKSAKADEQRKTTTPIRKEQKQPSAVVSDRKPNVRKSSKKSMVNDTRLELTIPNLYDEIVRQGIRHPKIVLAQSILETGWFRSHACRTKNNLFGLTNPKTGKYFEFDHWTDSVKAYYSMVQYKYKGNGNYLLWLKKIGYAEDKGYIRAVIRVLRML